MNLRWFHALLILLSAALAVLFGLWCLNQYGREDGIGNARRGHCVFRRVVRPGRCTTRGSCGRQGRCDETPSIRLGITRVLTTAAAVLIGGSSSVFACPVCFGAEETSMIDGARLGVLVMLGVLFAVQGAFVGFFLYLRKRAKRIAEIDLDTEWSELQGGASRT